LDVLATQVHQPQGRVVAPHLCLPTFEVFADILSPFGVVALGVRSGSHRCQLQPRKCRRRRHRRHGQTRSGCPRGGVQVHCLHCTSRSWRPLAELTTLRFVEDAADALVLGPVRVGKTFLASALGHIACRRRFSMHFEWADRLHRRLKATRLDASHDAEMRKLMRVDLFLIADFALRSLDASDAADFCELVVETTAGPPR
ncbi:MAG: hypothetical protein QOK20_430, partial [Acidimicrobiaceae bacterium]|nr:hypothetical protein [Acidimicrobiaceae bacterium]